jgi:hypothetical protein
VRHLPRRPHRAQQEAAHRDWFPSPLARNPLPRPRTKPA